MCLDGSRSMQCSSLLLESWQSTKPRTDHISHSPLLQSKVAPREDKIHGNTCIITVRNIDALQHVVTMQVQKQMPARSATAGHVGHIPLVRCRKPHVCHSVMADTAQGVGLEVLSSIKGSLCSAAAQTALHLNLFGAGAACAADSTRTVQLDIAADLSNDDIVWPVALSLLAGLSTSIGGIIAVALTPGESTLAFMLGTGTCMQLCCSSCCTGLS